MASDEFGRCRDGPDVLGRGVVKGAGLLPAAGLGGYAVAGAAVVGLVAARAGS
ncbi:hypothetical protein ACFXKC_53245 [Streptomyces sp. NPDC059340]|uniref:hypothetical protein n=1 Tax=Streptomyces sp. NPDC059340 TaxID=3346806 RepID=UPI003696ED3D